MRPRRKLIRIEDMAKILVVDDDPDFVNLTRTILRSKDYEVITAANGEQALTTMRKDKPDLVLLDIMMAYILDGLDVGREMAEDVELKDIPVIMVTSLTGARAQVELPSDEYIPVEDWIHKPIDPDDLLERIEAALG
jgi:CheY-like chemotaxis protein